MTLIRSFSAACLMAAILILTLGCAMTADRDLPEPRTGFVEDETRFNDFIREHQPTPSEFRAVYPDVTLVLPGQIATKELRMNNSRFFARLDDDGRITDGRFQ